MKPKSMSGINPKNVEEIVIQKEEREKIKESIIKIHFKQ